MLPIEFPQGKNIKIHRIAVTRGIYKACKKFYGGKSIGSLMIDSSLIGDEHVKKPFCVGQINPSKGFVHIFEEFTLDAIFEELDTVVDFIEYLNKREELLTRKNQVVRAPGDEQLLGHYLTSINSKGEHDFVLAKNNPDFINFTEGFYEDMVSHKQYIEKKHADRDSYLWDSLIQTFIKYANDEISSDLEKSIKHMASEGRFSRRVLSNSLYEFVAKNTGINGKASRVMRSLMTPEKIYVFLKFTNTANKSTSEYCKVRIELLKLYCMVIKLQFPVAKDIIGIASEFEKRGSEDFVYLDARVWTPKMQKEAIEAQNKYDILQNKNMTQVSINDSEWPRIQKKHKNSKDKKPTQGLNRAQRRAQNKKKRKKTK